MPEKGTAVILGPDLVALLQDMGLAWDEVLIYQFLLNASSTVSSAIVEGTGQSHRRIREALSHLAEKGLVRQALTRPIQFQPTPLSEILADAHIRLTRQLDAVKVGQGIALKAATPETALPLLAPTRPKDVGVFGGRAACHAEWNRMLGGAEKFFWLTGGENLANRLAAMPEFLDGLRSAHTKGLNVQLVLPKTAGNSKALEAIAIHVGPDVLHVAPVDQFGPLVSCATDQSAMEVISQPDDASPLMGDDVAIEVSSELFANATKQRLELAESFQKGSAPVYQWLGPDQGSDLFLGAVRAAKEDVLVLGPREWSHHLARDWDQNAETYREAKARGVRFRALTVRGEDDKKALGAFAEVWDIRIVDWHPVWLTLVDNRELYQTFTHPSLGGPPQFRQSREPNEIKFYSAVFDRLWARGQAV